MASKATSCAKFLAEMARAMDAIRSLNLRAIVNGTILGLAEAIDELLQVKAYPDPAVEFEIEELRQALVELKTLIMKRFIPGCKALAKYVTDKGQLDRIRADLRAGKAEKLQEYLNVLEKRFKNCQDRAADFQKEYEELKENVRAAIKKHGGKQKELGKGIEFKKQLQQGLMMGGGVSAATGVVVASACSAGLAGAPIVILVLGTGLLGAVTATGAACVNDLVIRFRQEDLTRMILVTKCINELNVDLGKVNNHFSCILSDLKHAQESLETVVQTGEPIDTKDVDTMMYVIEELKENMETTLQTCETAKSLK